MTRERNKLYSIVFIACLAGYIWLYVNRPKSSTENIVEVCFIKHATDIPCPSCGSTRAIISLTKGDFMGALTMNPLGYVVAIMMLLAPLWVIADLISRSKSLFIFYQKVEAYLKKPKVAIPFISLIIVNWIWNIAKGL